MAFNAFSIRYGLAFFVAILFCPQSGETVCNYSTSTVLEMGNDNGLPGVDVNVTDDTATKDITRGPDCLYSLTINDRNIPYTLEFKKANYQAMWLSNLPCNDKLEELEIVRMTKQSQIPQLTADELQRIINNYKKALSFADEYKQTDLKKSVKEALEQLNDILKKGNKPMIRLTEEP